MYGILRLGGVAPKRPRNSLDVLRQLPATHPDDSHFAKSMRQAL